MPDSPLHPLKERNLVTINPLFATITSLSHSLLPVKVFHFVQLPEVLFYLLEGVLPDS